MKSIEKFCAPFLLWFALAPVAAPADTAVDTESTAYSLSFDNGAGLSGSATHYLFNSRHGGFYAHNGAPVSRFFVRHGLRVGALHYGGTMSEDEQHYYGGASLGPATLAYFQGRGHTFSKAENPLYSDLNQYLFHGGKRSVFELRGAAASVEVGGGLSTQVAASTVSAPNRDNRHAYYAGLAGRRVEAGLYQLDRGGDKVGQGLHLAFTGRTLDLRYQELRSEYGAHSRRIAFQWRAGASRSFAVELEQLENDLFPDGDEQRLMFRFRKSLGRPSVLHAAEQGGGEEEAEQPGFGRAVGIGVGLGIAAIAVSSGSGGEDGVPRFAARNDAAFSVLNDINPVSVRQNIEHGGWIYRNADNSFGYTDPVAGTVSMVNIGNPATAVPAGTAASASYHTHGGPDPRFDNENFSPQDLAADRLAGVDGYLGTPAGFMKLHDRETGSIRVLGRIRN